MLPQRKPPFSPFTASLPSPAIAQSRLSSRSIRRFSIPAHTPPTQRLVSRQCACSALKQQLTPRRRASRRHLRQPSLQTQMSQDAADHLWVRDALQHFSPATAVPALQYFNIHRASFILHLAQVSCGDLGQDCPFSSLACQLQHQSAADLTARIPNVLWHRFDELSILHA